MHITLLKVMKQRILKNTNSEVRKLVESQVSC